MRCSSTLGRQWHRWRAGGVHAYARHERQQGLGRTRARADWQQRCPGVALLGDFYLSRELLRAIVSQKAGSLRHLLSLVLVP